LIRVRKILSILFAAIAIGCDAGCWPDARLSALKASIAQTSFPAVADTPIVVCSDDTFALNVGGVYEASRLIRIPVWQLGSTMLTQVVAHELAHAEVHRRGGDMHTNGGHSREFMSVLIAAGFGAEAQRTAYATPGAINAFATAQQATQARSLPEYEPVPTGASKCGPIPCRPRIGHGTPPQIAYQPPQFNNCKALPVRVHSRGPDGRWHHAIEYRQWCE